MARDFICPMTEILCSHSNEGNCLRDKLCMNDLNQKLDARRMRQQKIDRLVQQGQYLEALGMLDDDEES
jgi:hypothetical protein